jgi:VCBS repeat-containing protein
MNARTYRITGFAVLLVAAGLLLAACNFQDGQIGYPTPIPTQAVEPAASISGKLWHDICAQPSQPPDQDEVPPAGCVKSDVLGGFLADGVMQPGELGIADVRVTLGRGPCPASVMTETRTAQDGSYVFTGLQPGTYCLSIWIGGSSVLSSASAGAWTFPRGADGKGTGELTITVGPGENLVGINFGWDYQTLPAPPTPEPTPTVTPVPIPVCSDAATFVKDVSIPDGTSLARGSQFEKTWRLRNSGTCAWTANYRLVYVSGDRLGAIQAVALPGNVTPGSTVDLSVDLQAPQEYGAYKGYWMLMNAQGNLFGLGTKANEPFWVSIRVQPNTKLWLGEYYSNRTLQGDPVLIRSDEKIDFNWKYGSPDGAVPVDNFSARWTRRVSFEKGIYRFHVGGDDGFRLWIDGRLVVDQWRDGGNREVTIDLDLQGGEHDVRVDFYERGGVARVHFSWERMQSSSYQAWLGRYWFDRTMSSKWALVRSDASIDFNWKAAAPAQGLPADNFSAAWTRSLTFDPSLYRFNVQADDAVRVYIGNAVVINEWHDATAAKTFSAEVQLSGKVDVRVEYYEHQGAANIKFWWEKLSSPPVAKDDSYSTQQGTPLTVAAPGVLANDTVSEGHVLTCVSISGVSHGSLALQTDGSFIYVPDAGFMGVDSFTYKASDGTQTSGAATVTINVKAVNHAPGAANDTYSVDEDAVLSVAAPGVLANDTDPDSDALQAVLAESVSHGTLTLNADGSFTYTPQKDFNGADSFTYRASDGGASSSPATVIITVTAVDDVPVAQPDAVLMEKGSSVKITVLSNDTGLGDTPIALAIVTPPSKGSATVTEDGAIRYTPAEDFQGIDSFEYRVTDNDGDAATAGVEVTVTQASALVGALRDALVGKDCAALGALMNAPFTIAYWQGDTTPLTPQDATALLCPLLPPNVATAFVLDTTKFPSIEGLNPWTMWGEGVNVVVVIYSQGWGQDGKGEAFLTIIKDAQGVYHWIGMSYAPQGYLSGPPQSAGLQQGT